MEGLRGVAVLLVFLIHFDTLFNPCVAGGSFSRRTSEFLGHLGWTGVELFFILSGYLIYGILMARPIGYVAFQKRRMQRIYPTFLVVLAVYLGLSVAFPAESKIPADRGGGDPVHPGERGPAAGRLPDQADHHGRLVA